jgi:hypothetical protein
MYIPSSYPSRLGAVAWPVPGPRRIQLPALYLNKYNRRGMGDSPSSTQIAGGITAGATTGAAVAISTGSSVAGAIAGGLLAAAPFTGPAAPFVAALGLIVGPIAKMFAGCGQTCVQATTYANQSGTAFDQILDLYYAQPVRTVSMQQAALQNIQQIVTWLQQACSSPSLGAAGQRCISERLTPTGTPPGCITSYGAPMTAGDPGYAAGLPCNVYTFYINRIAGDTAVVPDSSVSSSSSSSSSSSDGPVIPSTIAGVPIQNLLVPAALIAAIAFLS